MCVSVSPSVFMFCFVVLFFNLEGLGEGGGVAGRGIAEITVSHTASNRTHGKVLHLWSKCLLEKHVVLLYIYFFFAVKNFCL